MLVIISIPGCSFIRLAYYVDVDNNQKWKIGQGVSVLRDSDFEQASWQYELEDISINVQPLPLKQFTLFFWTCLFIVNSFFG